MDYRTAFEEVLKADPYDIHTRLTFADWLEDNGFDDEVAEQRRRGTPEWCAADRYLRAYAERMNPYDLSDPYKGTEYEGEARDWSPHLGPHSEERAFQRLIEGLREQDLFAYGTDLHGLYELDHADELKLHAEVWLGKDVDWNNFSFSCSC